MLEHPKCGAYVPSAFAVEAISQSVLSTVAESLGIPFLDKPPAWNLLEFSASIVEYERQLSWSEDEDPRWLRTDFSCEDLAFRSTRSQATLRLSCFSDPITKRLIHRYWREGHVAVVDRDWSRWMYLRDLGLGVLRYDNARQALRAPASVPFPCLVGRALTLFSGRAPAHEESLGRFFDTYEAVPREAANAVADKLGQTITSEE